MSGRTTIEFVGARNVDVVLSMTTTSFRVSVVLCVPASGYKLKPFIVFAGSKGGKVRQELVQKNAWWDESIMHKWIDEVWAPNVQSASVLLLDSLKVHKMSSVRSKLEELQNFPQCIRPGATSVLQPLDVSDDFVTEQDCKCIVSQYLHPRDDSYRYTQMQSRVHSSSCIDQ
ncbi:TPA: hypothetical protein N0F65_003235 [Lagenidium giganteum]|uniref:DDE-1 domain-containing protein n=1 Tax=Lagenidium giganteum TaxID=4803 RepID=A0AAV2ZBU0_9STRA|nr:TPA: hypothetical protein N0F65_003235 [Lagenidium giganteum]